jgi:hypothetical protein
MMLALLASGCAGTKNAEVAEAPPAKEAVQKTEQLVYEGEIAGVSERAKTISITVGKGEQAKVMMVKFDDKTKGVNQAAKGKAAQITYELRDKDAYATDVQLKFAKLPPGTTEIKFSYVDKMF